MFWPWSPGGSALFGLVANVGERKNAMQVGRNSRWKLMPIIEEMLIHENQYRSVLSATSSRLGSQHFFILFHYFQTCLFQILSSSLTLP